MGGVSACLPAAARDGWDSPWVSPLELLYIFLLLYCSASRRSAASPATLPPATCPGRKIFFLLSPTACWHWALGGATWRVTSTTLPLQCLGGGLPACLPAVLGLWEVGRFYCYSRFLPFWEALHSSSLLFLLLPDSACRLYRFCYSITPYSPGSPYLALPPHLPSLHLPPGILTLTLLTTCLPLYLHCHSGSGSL